MLYLISFIMIIQSGRTSGSFDSLEGIVKLVSNPNAVFVDWIHYLSLDIFVARAISLDAVRYTRSYLQYILLIGPCLFFCLLAGSVWLLLYAIEKNSVFKGMTKENDSWRGYECGCYRCMTFRFMHQKLHASFSLRWLNKEITLVVHVPLVPKPMKKDVTPNFAIFSILPPVRQLLSEPPARLASHLRFEVLLPQQLCSRP